MAEFLLRNLIAACIVFIGGFSTSWADPDASCLVAGKPVAIPAELCPRAIFAGKIFQNLLPLAGFAPNDVQFRILPNHWIQAQYEPGPENPAVYVSFAWLQTYGGNEPAVIWTLSHELGHGLQQRAGWLVWSDVDHVVFRYNQERMEADADLLGGRIAERAGYPPSTYLSGFEFVDTCAAVRDPAGSPDTEDSDGKYPSIQDRWFNMAAYQTLINALEPAPSANGADAESPAISPEDFTLSGAFRPSALVSSQVKDRDLLALRNAGIVLPTHDGESAIQALDLALDAIIEPEGTRGALAQSCGSALGAPAEALQERLREARSGDAAWLIQQLRQRAVSSGSFGRAAVLNPSASPHSS